MVGRHVVFVWRSGWAGLAVGVGPPEGRVMRGPSPDRIGLIPTTIHSPFPPTPQSTPPKPEPHSRQYADMGAVFGSDPTWGVLNVIAKACRCTPVDIAAPDELRLDPPPAQR